MSGSVVCAPQRIPHRVCQLVLDEVWPEAQHLVQHGSRHRPKAVPGDGVTVIAQVTQCGIDRVLAHWPLRAPDPREDELASRRDGFEVPEDLDRLGRQRDDMRGACLAGGKTPLARVQIDVGPTRFSQLTWPYEQEGSQLQGSHRDR